jgi:hypothetical protein
VTPLPGSVVTGLSTSVLVAPPISSLYEREWLADWSTADYFAVLLSILLSVNDLSSPSEQSGGTTLVTARFLLLSEQSGDGTPLCLSPGEMNVF